MIIVCPNCGTMFNNETVPKCNACKTGRRKRNRSQRRNEAQAYMFAQIKEKRCVVNSTRAAGVSKYEREKKKEVFNKF